ncbi:Uncharacterised protein [Clostridioides difficile]|nr:Uncharacterised protein [Clostridioides difficile]VIG11030.1 Uncharacterised protein [Clostridioides difficile]
MKEEKLILDVGYYDEGKYKAKVDGKITREYQL